jgi:hypothetical protein
MSHVDQTRLAAQIGDRHQGGRPYHYSTVSQEDRIRRVFGLDGDKVLPPVNDNSLAAYYEHLAGSLAMPFEALYCPTGGKTRHLIHYVRVLELTDPRHVGSHNPHGLACKAQNAKSVLDLPLAELGVRDDNPNCQLIDDYAYWFVNWR